MKPRLRIPAMLGVAVLTTATTVGLLAACGGDDTPTTCDVYCVPEGNGQGSACQGEEPTCATGPDLDQCPAGCIPEPVA